MNMNNDAAEFHSIVHRNLRRKKVGLGPLRLLSFLGITMGVLILMAMATPSAHAALETYYDFEDTDFTSDPPGLQTTSIATIGFGFLTAGTQVNAVTPSMTWAIYADPIAGVSTSFTLGGLTTTGLTDVALSLALVSQGTGGFTTLQLSYSTTGVNGTYTDFPLMTGTDSNLQSYTDYTRLPFDAPAAVDGISGSNLFFKFSFSGGTDSGVDTRIDNIQVNAAVVPEPSSYIGGLFGLVGLCWYQRRRFMRLLSLRSA